MYAIVEIAGQQFKVSKDQKVFVHRLQNQEGEKVAFNNVLLLDNNGTITVGAPAIDGASVEAKVVKHLKGDKVIVFKKKRRKGFKVKNGHRQYLTEILVENIIASGAAAKPAKTEKKEEKPSKSAKADDLKKIEGIGPKASEALVAAGVDTFAKLAKKSADEIKTILAEASSTLAHLDPQTWAAQAQLAADGKWDELKKWQDELNGGIVK
ncbi:50S ribosomal protein L21 [Capnocytophaga stomatis]|uniref:Large ribosomal subunit protein bL21 n=1 Tax=Capnocytophaga stomatis TaxID=1848904 RepID=A0A250FVH8_9FLAO|nr:50S ribosomal protein L21 [Capnocytophaga stomatis]ATA89120.1 50S ribosomal protein L21 [Capnocytophaga stomatis]GIJ93946.1 50S ribosomal protein L21 [Capnocytophaga stomatis]GIM48663.1 50S ribosomal protein L21 [Capnocytophaga stomatis]